MTIDELFEGIKDFFSGCFEGLADILSPAIDVILDFLGSAFGVAFSWIFAFISGDFLKTISGYGISFFDTVAGAVSNNISSGQYIYFMIGSVITFPLLKIVINIIRG